MEKIALFTVGASAGGLEALQKLVSGLPRDFPAAIWIVVHISPNSPGLIAEILNAAGDLPARKARTGDPVEAGQILVAPPDHHLLVDSDGRALLGRGPKENRFRPAVDPLFRSAALALGGRVAGIILSGGLDDGASGLFAIKQCGGMAIVQEPNEAIAPSMPRAALRTVTVDARLRVAEMPALMLQLATAYRPNRQEACMTSDLDKEVQIAAGVESHIADAKSFGEPSPFTCPECHGALLRLHEGGGERFRCHTGHAFTEESLAAEMQDAVERALWVAARALEEQAALLSHMATHPGATDAEARRREAELARRRGEGVRDALNSGSRE